MYDEIEGETNVAKKLLEYDFSGELTSLLPSISPFADFSTTRKTYHLNQMRVDIDTSSFGYIIVEIEQMCASELEVARTVQEIKDFARSLNIHSDDQVKGKLDIYMAKFCASHYKVLQEAGILLPSTASIS